MEGETEMDGGERAAGMGRGKNGKIWILGEGISRHRPNYRFTLGAHVR